MNKIDGKFYPLQNSEWVEICKSLTKSQISVLYYLRSLDPYGNGIRIKASRIADDLGISKRAVNAAIAVLEEKSYIDLEDIDYSVRVSAGGCLCDTMPTVTKAGREFPTREENFSLENGISHLRTEFPAREENFPLENGISHLKPEAETQQELQNSKINKTYSDFKDSLSISEREDFLKFGKKRAGELKNPPVQLPQKWIEKNWEELSAQWFKTRDKNQNYNFAAYSEPQHQMWYQQLQAVVSGAAQSGDSARLEQFLKDDFYSSWFNWAKTAREDVREFLASNPIPT